MTPETQALIRSIVEAKPRQFVKWPEVAAIIEIESGGVSTFEARDCVYFRNLSDASIILSPLTKDQISEAFKIRSGAMAGLVVKFRVEPGYALRAMKVAPHNPRLSCLLSASVGLGQQMVAGVSGALGSDETACLAFIDGFIASEADQIERCASLLDSLIGLSPTDRALAYSRYNEGAHAAKPTSYGARALRWVKAFAAPQPAPVLPLSAPSGAKPLRS